MYHKKGRRRQWSCCSWRGALPRGGTTSKHGQEITADSVRACKDTISSNSVPAFCRGSMPGVSSEQMNLQIKLSIPRPVQHLLDFERIKAIFPYGEIISCEVVEGGMICSSGTCIEAM